MWCQLKFERAEEAFHHRIVIRHAGPAHAQHDIRCLRFRPVAGARVLAAAVMVKHHVGPKATVHEGHGQSPFGQIPRLLRGHGPSDDPSAAHVQHGCQVQPSFAGGQVGDVADPHLIGRKAGKRPGKAVESDKRSLV